MGALNDNLPILKFSGCIVLLKIRKKPGVGDVQSEIFLDCHTN